MNLAALNKEQRLAAETLEGPVLILAGAGSGKTRALTYRVANLLDHGVAAFSILALTFTNKAAREMKTRVLSLVGDEASGDIWISTFHSTCARILRRDIEKLGYSRSFVIFDDDDQMRLLKDVYKQLNLDDKVIPVREAKSKISDAKNALLSPDEWFGKSGRDYRSSRIHDVMTVYEKRMKAQNALDFDDLLLKTLELFADHPPVLDYYQRRFSYVLVDEYQDTNKAQYEFVRLLTAKSRNLCVVGDDDQSIYGWRGADIHNILDFEKDYPDAVVIRLEQNYRSTSNILDAANQVIAHNSERKDKQLWTEEDAGEKIQVYCASDERDEARWIVENIRKMKLTENTFGNTAILYRTNAQSRVPEETLIHAGIPYRVFGGQRFYDRKEIKDILAYLRVIVNPADDISIARIINVPKRSIGETTVQALTDSATEKDVPLFSVLADPPESLNARARKNVLEFFMMMTLFSAQKETMGLEEFVTMLIEKTGLEEQYQREETEEAQNRLENINEMKNSVHEYVLRNDNPTLEGYLENVALVTDLDRDSEQTEDSLVLMTLHSAKGLEFDNVFIPGLEENIFPSFRSLNEENRLEEERRLMYVGITRARKRLFLSYASSRMMFDGYRHNPPSQFLSEIPDRLLVKVRSGSLSGSFRTGSAPSGPAYARIPSYAGREKKSRSDAGSESRKTSPLYYGTGAKRIGFSPENIPGVSRGFVQEGKTKENHEKVNSDAIYQAGDHIIHSSFGKGVILSVSGTGRGLRASVMFDHAGRKDLALALAPIRKAEEEQS